MTRVDTTLHGATGQAAWRASRAGARRRRTRTARERGAAMVEFALVLPMLLVLVFGIIDFGRAFQGWITLSNAAREGARLGATGGTATEIKNRVVTTAGVPLTVANVTVANATDQGGRSGESVTVQSTYTLRLITPLGAMLRILAGGSGVGNTFTLTANADMRLE